MKVIKKKCEECGSVLAALSQSQMDYNFRVHMDKHQREKDKEKKQNE